MVKKRQECTDLLNLSSYYLDWAAAPWSQSNRIIEGDHEFVERRAHLAWRVCYPSRCQTSWLLTCKFQCFSSSPQVLWWKTLKTDNSLLFFEEITDFLLCALSAISSLSKSILSNILCTFYKNSKFLWHCLFYDPPMFEKFYTLTVVFIFAISEKLFEPHYEIETKCKVFIMKISLHSYANKCKQIFASLL